jgi:hypothetical protein
MGYPGNHNGQPWWDEELVLPIIREASISSYPGKSFFNKLLKGSHNILVSGLSFGGSSGSPIFNIGTQIAVGAGLVMQGGIEAKLIGVMAGHLPFVYNDHLPIMIKHSGLSYFVDSTAIIDLLNNKNSERFLNIIKTDASIA